MLYLMFVLVVVAIFMCFFGRERKVTFWLVLMLLSYAGFICFLLLYVGKDAYFFNIVNRYFNVNKVIWKKLIFLPIPKMAIARLLNDFACIFVCSCVHFSWSFAEHGIQRIRRIFCTFATVVLALEMLFFDPAIQQFLYDFLYPAYCSASGYKVLENFVYRSFYGTNILFLISGICVLGMCFKRSPRFPSIRIYSTVILFCYLIITLSYIVIGSGLPMGLLQISKVAQYIRFRSIPLGKNAVVYNMFPYFILAAVLVLALYIYKLLQVHKALRNNELSISMQLDAAETITKVFCHYMKNELLTLQEYAEVMEENPEECMQLSMKISSKCARLYDRLDEMYNSVRISKLTLHRTHLNAIVEKRCTQLQESFPWADIQLEQHDALFAMLDENCFGDALGNLLRNAAEENRPLEQQRRKITISISSYDRWAIVEVRDLGRGIQPDLLNRVFEPFYSSKPVRTNWGIGLALTHRIISGHGGRIFVESTVGKGTVFKIMLPLIP